jgi:CubicO group peptidase (beta-lactamase class C family)
MHSLKLEQLMKKIVFTSLLSFFVTISFFSYSQNKFIAVDQELIELNKERAFSGSVLVAKSGKVIYQKYIGYADIEHTVPNGPNTKFELASVSKIFTAVLILQLAEGGKINLDAKVSEYIPEFTRSDSGQITIHNLLSHTSGIQDFVGLNCDFASWTSKQFLEGLQKTPINFKAGTQFQYASSTYILLRFIIEKVTGKTYEANLKEHIFKIAGMTNSGVILNHQIITNRALGYVDTGENYQNALTIANPEIFIGASSVYSTVEDLLKFDQVLYTDKLLRQKEKDLMYTVVQPPYGYGWFISEDAVKGKVLSHGGDIFGYTTLIERRLKNNVVIIILGNLQSINREKIINILDKTLN